MSAIDAELSRQLRENEIAFVDAYRRAQEANRHLDAVLRRARVEAARPYSEARLEEREVFQADVAAILRALDLGDHARPTSAHQVVREEIIPTIERRKWAQYSCMYAYCSIHGRQVFEIREDEDGATCTKCNPRG